jgi:putative flippase GtrA
MPKKSYQKVLIQFITFNLVGLLNTAIDFLMFSFLIWLGAYYLIAQIIAYGAGMLNSFVLNSRYTFSKGISERANSQRHQMNTSVRFVVWNSILLGITLLLLAAFKEWWGLSELPAKLIVTVVTVVLNFYGSKKWVFKVNQPQIESS